MAAASELRDQMERAFGLLPADYRDVIALSRIVGLSRAEIAEHTGRTEASVRMLMSRALTAFIAAMDQVRGERRTTGPDDGGGDRASSRPPTAR
jgi:DNA-directed RNA polymerase specialized sigma24 family protein